MLTIEHIIRKLINIEDNLYLNNRSINDNIHVTFKIHFSLMISHIQTFNEIKGKYIYLKSFLSNVFYTDEIKEQFVNYFYKIQKVNMGFKKIAYLYKYNKSKIVVDTDMELNVLTINSKNVICIYQLNNRYLFNIKDVIKHLHTSLTNSDTFFAMPIALKNPYNNIPFNKSTLYNIYFFIKFNTNIYSELLFKYFNVNFNLKSFLYKYEYLLREYAIENFVKNSPKNILYDEILTMLEDYNSQYTDDKYKILIDHDFPRDILIKIMKPYLLYYYIGRLSMIPNNKYDANFILGVKLNSFQQHNPQFGRKYIKILYSNTGEPPSRYVSAYTYNDRHIMFEPVNQNFLSDHLNINPPEQIIGIENLPTT